MNITFELTADERNILLEQVPYFSDEVRSRLGFGVVQENALRFEMPPELFINLVEGIEIAAATTDDPDIIGILMPLYDILEEAGLDEDALWLDEEDDEWSEEEDEDDLGDGDDESPAEAALREDMLQMLRERRPETRQEAFALVKTFMEERISCPLPEFDGLSAVQVDHLLTTPWDSPDAAMVLNENIPCEMIENTIMMKDALLLLRKVHECGGVKLTAKGNLNLKFVGEIRDILVKRGDAPLALEFGGRKRWSEDELPSINVIRHLLMGGGFLRKIKGQLKVTKKGERVLKQENAGVLFAGLFHTYFRKFNIEYTDIMPEVPLLQDAIAYSFLMIKRYAENWITARDLAEHLFPSFVRENFPFHLCDFIAVPGYLAHYRVLIPLMNFGLLAIHPEAQARVPDYEVRKTPLFDAFFEFRLD